MSVLCSCGEWIGGGKEAIWALYHGLAGHRLMEPTAKYDEAFIQRFWSKVRMNGSGLCWEWTGAIADTGYGIIMRGGRANRKALLVHRVAWELTGHLFGQKDTIDHLCRNRRCVNPLHLQAVSQAENNRRANTISTIHAKKVCCPKCGGEYRRMSSGERRCIPCRLARRRERYAQGVRNA